MKTQKNKTEKFKTVINFNNYRISNFGRLQVKDGKEWIDAKCYVDNQGYVHTTMRKKAGDVYIVKSTRIHNLVMQHFIGTKKSGMVINHLDGDKENNHINNLEYCTQGDNIRHAFATGLMCNKKGRKRSMPVAAINLEDKKTMVFKSQAACARALNTSTSTVYQLVKGSLKSVNGYQIVALKSLS